MNFLSSPWELSSPPMPEGPALEGTARTDVAIVGGGYTGLSLALHLRERGVDATVLEAHHVGYGGSGRNGGQVIPGLKYDPDELEKRFGTDQGQLLTRIISQTVEDVFALIQKHGISCDATRAGWIQAAHDPVAVRTTHRRAEQWIRRGVAAIPLDRQAIGELIGSDLYHGGWLEPRAANLDPLAYTRGLARAAIQAGATLYSGSRVTGLQRTGTAWRIQTGAGGILVADRVVLATNGYTDAIWPGLKQSLIAANSLQIATRPLCPELRERVLPGGQSVSDTRRVLRYFRLDSQGRLIMGGRGPFREPRPPQDFAHLDESIAQMWPQLKDEPIEHRWGGRVALTRDFLPHLHAPAPGILACLGYNGRGVGMATSLGRLVADFIVSPDSAPLPLPFTQITPIPLHGLHTAYVSVLIAWYRFLDGLGIG